MWLAGRARGRRLRVADPLELEAGHAGRYTLPQGGLPGDPVRIAPSLGIVTLEDDTHDAHSCARRMDCGQLSCCLLSSRRPWRRRPRRPHPISTCTYRTAFDKATKIEELFPYMAKSMRAEVDETPAAERAKMFEIVKMMGALTNLKIVRETKTADGATLTVEALDSDKKKTTGKIDIVRENGVWKLGGESWSSQF